MEVAPPDILKTPLNVPHRTLMGPGPSNCSPRVLRALSRGVLGHMHPEVFQIMDEIKEGIKYVFQTRNGLTLALSASGHAGMEAILSNLLEPGERVLIAVGGIWGTRAADMAIRYGASVIKLAANLGDNLSVKQVENIMQRVRPKLLFVVQGESSTGVCQPLEGLGDLCERYNCLLAVDAVASLGGMPFFMDKWKIDAAYTGSQKVLGAPPGITPISFSAKSQKVIFSRKTPPPVYYWDMKILGQQWNCYNNVRPYHHTTCSNLLYALREALAEVAAEGIEKTIQRHKSCAQRLYRGLENLGLEFFVKDVDKRLTTVTTVLVPDGVDWKEIVGYAMKNHNLEISGGLGPTAGKVLRIGLMGYNATNQNVDLVLSVLKDALKYVAQNKSSKL